MTTLPHTAALVEAWLHRSRDLGHHPVVNYNDWGGTYYTAACTICKATMSLRIRNGYSARGVAWRNQCLQPAGVTPTIAAMTSEERIA